MVTETRRRHVPLGLVSVVENEAGLKGHRLETQARATGTCVSDAVSMSSRPSCRIQYHKATISDFIQCQHGSRL